MIGDCQLLTMTPEMVERELDRNRTNPSALARLLRALELAESMVMSGPVWLAYARANFAEGIKHVGLQAVWHALTVEPRVARQLGSKISPGLASEIGAACSLADVLAARDRVVVLAAMKQLRRDHPASIPVAFHYASAMVDIDPAAARRATLFVLEHCPTLYRALPAAVRRMLDREPACEVVCAAARRASMATRELHAPAARPPVSEPDRYVGRTFCGYTISAIQTSSRAFRLYRGIGELGGVVTLCRSLVHEAGYSANLFRDQVAADLLLRGVSRAIAIVIADDGTPLLVLQPVRGHFVRDRFTGVWPGLAAALRLTSVAAREIDGLYRHHAYIHGALDADHVVLVDDLDSQSSILLIDTAIDVRRQLGVPGPCHIAPEPEGPSHASDVYGLGSLLFWCVTGRSPDRSSLEDARFANDGPGRAVKQLLARCLAYQPTDRFQTAGEVADAVDAIGGVGAPE